MSAINPTNHLLQVLPRKERSKILKSCNLVDLVFGTVLCESDQPFQHVYFPITGFISLVAPMDGHPPLEMGLIGDEGMLGATLVLGVNTAPLHAVVQGSGTALQMTTLQFLSKLRASPSLSNMLKRYLYVLMAQLSQSAACTRFHEVDARLARWLLMTHDRAQGDHFYLTHQFLADMLGVQRSAVTIAAGSMQKRKLIRYVRGDIRILDRRALEEESCECYGAMNQDYIQLFA